MAGLDTKILKRIPYLLLSDWEPIQGTVFKAVSFSNRTPKGDHGWKLPNNLYQHLFNPYKSTKDFIEFQPQYGTSID